MTKNEALAAARGGGERSTMKSLIRLDKRFKRRVAANYSRAALVAAVAVLSSVFAHSALAWEPINWWEDIHAYYGDRDHTLAITHTGEEYIPPAACSKSSHRSTHNVMRFDHIHWDAQSSPPPDFPYPGTDDDLNDHMIYADEVDSWYIRNMYYAPYYMPDTSTPATLLYNCHGYSLGITTWFQDPEPVITDDYTSATGWGDATLLWDPVRDHSVKVLGPSSEGDWVCTEEKFRDSGAFIGYWEYSDPLPSYAPYPYKKKIP
jgi:hypothetical protein